MTEAEWLAGVYWGLLGKTRYENGVPHCNYGYDSEEEAYNDLSETLLRTARAQEWK